VAIEESAVAFIVDFSPEVFAIADAETFCSLPSWDFGGEWSSGGSSHRLRDRLRMRYYIDEVLYLAQV
jgi:hypothetical protein